MRREFNQSRIDKNQPEIVKAFRKLGWYVKPVHDVKQMCDILVCKTGRVIAIEIKDGSKPPSKRKLSEGEDAFREAWLNAGGEWLLIESVEDVLKIAPVSHHTSGGRRSPE